jgi:hypothetical protein
VLIYCYVVIQIHVKTLTSDDLLPGGFVRVDTNLHFTRLKPPGDGPCFTHQKLASYI